jgi:hypothetical protein
MRSVREYAAQPVGSRGSVTVSLRADLWLGGKVLRLGHASLGAAVGVIRPGLRQIELMGTGRLACSLARERSTATWQSSCLPSWPQYCRATPTECLPFLGKPASSMIQARIGPYRSMAGSTCERMTASIAASDQSV